MRTLITSFIAVCLALPVLAQDAPKQKGGMREAPKNLKLLQPDQVMSSMRAFRTALGVQCTFCHVQGDFAADEKPEKLTARKMIAMTRQINANNFPAEADHMHVTCYTCHRGDHHPATEAPATPPPAK